MRAECWGGTCMYVATLIGQLINIKLVYGIIVQYICLYVYISKPKQIANAFNDFFISIGDGGLLNAKTKKNFNQYMPRKTNCTLRFEPITVDTISRIINYLKPKTSTGVDSVSNKLLKFVKNVISEPLSIIINQMLKSGIFPDSLKISKIVPLNKKR